MHTAPASPGSGDSSRPLVVATSNLVTSSASDPKKRWGTGTVVAKSSLIDTTLARALIRKRLRDPGPSPSPAAKKRQWTGADLASCERRALALSRTLELFASSSSSSPPSCDFYASSSSCSLTSSDEGSVEGCAGAPGPTAPPSLSLSAREALPIDYDVCPYDFIESALLAAHPTKRTPPPPRAAEFPPPTAAQVAGYTHDALAAVRSPDPSALRALHRAGRDLSARGRHGDGLLHAACRRGPAAIAAFLLEEVAVSPLVQDDYGRTPLHDACWRGEPAYGVVAALLRREPRLAYVRDVRGHRPFQYARREHWGLWNRFLARNTNLILI